MDGWILALILVFIKNIYIVQVDFHIAESIAKFSHVQVPTRKD